MAALREQVVAREYWTEAETLRSARDSLPPARARRTVHNAQNRQALLTRAIETQVIPRLLLARGAVPLRPSAASPTAEETAIAHIATLTGLVLAHELADASGFVDGLRLQGFSAESVCLDVLAPVARRLGELWDEDLCDFTEVTVGLWRLQQVLHDVSPAFHAELDHRQAGPRALLVPVSGEQHTFGLAMVVEFFRRANWRVWSGAIESNAELASLVGREAFAVVGFSVACGDRLEAVAACIRAVRRASRNPAVGIMVGGPAFVAHPELASLVGADATAVDGRQAVLQAEALLTLLPIGP
jgi:methanogenic corrinoid protein MtbC1